MLLFVEAARSDLIRPIAFLPAHCFGLGSPLLHTSWRQQLSEVVHRPWPWTFNRCCFPPFLAGQLSISIFRHPTGESLSCSCWGSALSWKATKSSHLMHDEILARPRFGSEARVDAACASRLTEKCGRREAVYVFPVFVDAWQRNLSSGPRYPR